MEWSDVEDPDYQDQNKTDLTGIWSEDESDNENYDVYENEFIPDYEHAQPLNAKNKNKPSRRGQRPAHVPSAEVQLLLDDCTSYFAAEEYDRVIDIAEEAIRIDPQALRAYQLLAAVYEELGDDEKLLGFKFAAMQLDKKNHDGWVELAKMSQKMGYFDQAIKCFTFAAKLEDKPDESVMRARIELYEQTGKHGRALDLLRKLRQVYKTDKQLLVQITTALVAMRRVNDAIRLYEDMKADNLDPSKMESGNVQDFGLSELNILAELYYKQNSFSKVIDTIKKTARWLADRSDEDYWDEFDDDTEYLPDERERVEFFKQGPFYNHPEAYNLPIDIRMKLLMARAQLGDMKQAEQHWQFLKELGVDDYEDLYFDVGKVFAECHEPELAIEVLLMRYRYFDGDPDFQMSRMIAKCFAELGQIEKAEDWFDVLISNKHNEVEARVDLMEIYRDAGRRDDEAEQLAQVVALRQEEKGGQVADEATATAAFIQNVKRKEKARGEPRSAQKMTQAERELEQQRQEQLVREKFAVYVRLFDKAVLERDLESLVQFRRSCKELWEVFSEHKRFFPVDRNSVYKITIRKPRQTRASGGNFGGNSIDDRIEQAASRLQTAAASDNLEEEQDEGPVAEFPTSFHGLSFDEWFDVCMRYSMLECQAGNLENGLYVVQKCKSANVFHQNEERRNIMDLVNVSAAYLGGHVSDVNDQLRRISTSHQLSNDSYRIYAALLPSGHESLAMFSTAFNQKFIHRQLKAIDQLVSKTKVKGAARVLKDISLDQESPLLLTQYAQLMLIGRSYPHALSYTTRALSIKPKDAMTLLTLALTHLGRSLQRQTANRQLQIMEGMSFMQEYYQIRSKLGKNEAQEADYNMGRAFHMLALHSYAVDYYRRALENHDMQGSAHDLSTSAAYNLQMIYYQSGNKKLARDIIEQYLTY